MTGPEHYQRAQELLQKAETARKKADREIFIAAAGVHATLAYVAVTAVSRDSGPHEIKSNWYDVVTSR
ncbi:hypothetical protein GCM10010435_44660 [Winogradskya consettensis]|uniref:Uncharacterized protein n=1 Tax=Winogradskya consettensis TaxID=113560 RepID=A0A919T1D2_9ACTN|nr:hypothetical protein [Actinoplanes consettensis]GIM82744.1 hypothetical protein Aco04nite_83050 [Actinoplanes consettensis]